MTRMKSQALLPASVMFDEHGQPMSADYGDRYHPAAGALDQARAVFLQGCGLPDRWRGRECFRVMETGFGLGHNFLATWQAWREDPARPKRLVYVSIERHPVDPAVVARLHDSHALRSLARELVHQWPTATPDLHRLSFDGGKVLLLLLYADIQRGLRELKLKADAFYLDGFAPRRNPQMWSVQVFKALGRLAAPDATLSTWCAAGQVRRDLITAGFDVQRVPGFAGERERIVARYAPRPGQLRHRRTPGVSDACGLPTLARGDAVLIIGAGLAGAACAAALAARGLHCTVLDRHGQAAAEASGNVAGLFHGVQHPHDGSHARLLRAAALQAERCYRPLIESGAVPGQLAGLLRLADAPDTPDTDPMPGLLAELGLPPGYVQALPASRVAEKLGLPAQRPAWFYPGGGWIDPAALVRHWLNQPGVGFRGHSGVQALRRTAQGWQAVDAQGSPLGEGKAVLLCNAAGARTLVPGGWSVQRLAGLQRGQITQVPARTPGLRAPALPVSGGGYALTLQNGSVVCGSTATRDDADAQLRVQDQAANLQRLTQLTGSRPEVDPAQLAGRVGWRFDAADRLPLLGAASPDEAAHGVLLCTALGSRGITWAPLLGDVMAALLCGDPIPLPASLLAALDPLKGRATSIRSSGS